MLETGEGSMGRVYKVGAPSQGLAQHSEEVKGAGKVKDIKCDIVGPELCP